jgi:hypothetical protein
VIFLKLVQQFTWNGDVVLLAADRAGLDAVSAALTEAQQCGFSRLQGQRRVHDFVVEIGAADLELGPDRVVWHLAAAKAAEIRDGMDVLRNDDHPGHVYVDDMTSPAPTLVLSRDEYLTPNWLTEAKTPLFDEDSPD